MSCSGIVHFQSFCVFSIFCARGKSQKTGRICSRGSLLLTLLGSWERKGGFIKQFYLKNSALFSLICYKRRKRIIYMIKKGTTRSTWVTNFPTPFFGRSAFTGVWVGVILAFLPWVQVELGGRKWPPPPLSAPVSGIVLLVHASLSPGPGGRGRECKWAPSSSTLHFLQIVFNPELSR